MREFIVENLTNTEALSVTVILMNNVIALIVAFFIMFTYKISYAGPAYSRKFNISIGSITIITAMIMSIISNNIALSLGIEVEGNAGDIAKKCTENGLLVITAKTLLRMLPPLNIKYDEIDEALAILKKVMEE